MQAVSTQTLQPDKAVIRAHFEYITARWSELDEPAWFNVRVIRDERAINTFYSPERIGETVDYIVEQNLAGYNIYSTINPVREGIAGKGAADSDILASFFLWADCDDQQATDNVRKFNGPKFSAEITTGTIPYQRFHTYWELDKPCRDLERWRALQDKIAKSFKSDGNVKNPARIMRIGGTVTHIPQYKVERGYQSQVTKFRTADHDPVTLDQMERVFKPPVAAASDGDGLDFNIDTGPAYGNSVDDYLDIIRRAGTDTQKHGGVRDLTAKMARGGATRNVIEAVVRTVCPVWDANVENLVQSALEDFRVEKEQKHVAPKSDRPPFKSWTVIDPAKLPPRDFIYGSHYIRKFASSTAAPGGLGKSSLALVECMAIATGRDLLGLKPKKRERVVYHCAEDPLDEIKRRVVAVCEHYDIAQIDLVDWLHLSSGRDTPLILATGDRGDVVEPVFKFIEDWAKSISPSVFVFDPLANMTEAPETNDVFRRLGKRLSKMADDLNCSIELVHHTRKLGGREAEVEDSRGGSALIGAVRAARVLNPMTADEAAKAQLETHVDHFRIEAGGKNNLSRSAPNAKWFRRVSVALANGDNVAVVEPWQWPDAFDGITAKMAAECQSKINGLDEPPRGHWQATNWVGHVIGEVLSIDTSEKPGRARVNAIIKQWVQEDVLAIEKQLSPRDGREVPVCVVGSNNMREVT